MDGMDTTTLSLLTGPTSSLVLLTGIVVAVWRIFTNTLIPAGKRWVDQHLSQVDRLLDQHDEDRQAWLESMQGDDRRHAELIESQGSIAESVDALRARIEQREAS